MTEDFRHAQQGSQASQERRLISITEAARLHNVTRQAIYVAIKQKKLKATKDASRWTIDLADLENYRRLL